MFDAFSYDNTKGPKRHVSAGAELSHEHFIFAEQHGNAYCGSGNMLIAGAASQYYPAIYLRDRQSLKKARPRQA